jgi:K+-sensing histidine kinase KdpD
LSSTLWGAQPFVFHLPESDPPTRTPELIVPIQAVRGVLGEIRLWRTAPAISSGARRLLQTFASQGALALERAWLAQAESRARVLEESDKLKSAILSSVSHELRTPLSTIKAAASSLRGKEVGWDSPARTEMIAAIDDEADHLNILVGNLLDMSRIESGALKPKREWNILSEIVGSVLARMKHSAEEHQIEVEIPENLPARICGLCTDGTSIYQPLEQQFEICACEYNDLHPRPCGRNNDSRPGQQSGPTSAA